MNQDAIQNAIDSIIPVISRYGLQIIGAILILIIGRIAAGIVGKLVRRALQRSKTDPALTNFLASFAGIAVMAFAVIAALAKFGIQTASFVAVLGAAGFAIGFALHRLIGQLRSRCDASHLPPYPNR
jgi:small conductance mechanosensitive channel